IYTNTFSWRCKSHIVTELNGAVCKICLGDLFPDQTQHKSSHTIEIYKAGAMNLFQSFFNIASDRDCKKEDSIWHPQAKRYATIDAETRCGREGGVSQSLTQKSDSNFISPSKHY